MGGLPSPRAVTPLFLYDLARGGMEIPAEFVYKTENKNLHDQMKEKTLEEVEKLKERRKIGLENGLEKKDFLLSISAVGK